MNNNRRRWLIGSALAAVLSGSLLIIWLPSLITRTPFQAPEASHQNWEEILAHPQDITFQAYSTGINETDLSGIMNLDHERAAGIEDAIIGIPVNVGLVEHGDLGAYLIDGGLDSSYVDNPYGTMKGFIVPSFLARGSQEPGTHIGAVLEKENIQLQGVWLTHLHFDHTAGVVDLPKDIPYVAGQGERYANFTFIIRGDHLAGIEELQEIDFSSGVDLPPLGKAVDLFGDGSLWAISSSGHSPGHVMFFINGEEEQILFTGDACNTLQQFLTGVGPGYYSSDLEGGQDVLDQIRTFKTAYPQVILSFGHDLETW